jgi:hypothetical protein
VHVVRGLKHAVALTRQASVTDRRRWTLTLPKRATVYLQAQALAHQASEQLLSPLNTEEQQQPTLLLEKLCQGLKPRRAPCSIRA